DAGGPSGRSASRPARAGAGALRPGRTSVAREGHRRCRGRAAVRLRVPAADRDRAALRRRGAPAAFPPRHALAGPRARARGREHGERARPIRGSRRSPVDHPDGGGPGAARPPPRRPRLSLPGGAAGGPDRDLPARRRRALPPPPDRTLSGLMASLVAEVEPPRRSEPLAALKRLERDFAAAVKRADAAG